MTIGITGLHEISSRDYEIEEPCWRPSLKGIAQNGYYSRDIELTVELEA